MSKTFKKMAAQGDIVLIAVDKMPETAKLATIYDGKYIVAHSETSHHHVIDAPRAELYESADDSFVAYIRTLGDGAELKHERSFDTHETIVLEPNKIYQVRRQREFIPEGFRKAAD